MSATKIYPLHVPIDSLPFAVLSACVRSTWDENARRRLQAFDLDLPDWQQFAEVCIAHRLDALVYQSLLEYHARAPEVLLQALRANFRATAIRRRLQDSAFAGLIRDLQDAGIDPIILKGPALAERVYADPITRPSFDLDLLVRFDEMPRAKQVLQQRGLQIRLAPTDPPARFKELIRGEQAFVKKEPYHFEVDLHTELIGIEAFRSAIRFDANTVRHRARRIRVLQREVLTLDDTDTLIYLCLHWAIGHQFGRLVSSVDLARWLAQIKTLNWREIVARSSEAKVRRIVYLSLKLCDSLWGPLPIPPEALAALQPKHSSLLTNSITVNSVKPEMRWRLDQSKHLVYVRLADDPWSALGIVRALLLPGRRWIALRYELTAAWQIALRSIEHPLQLALGLIRAWRARA